MKESVVISIFIFIVVCLCCAGVLALGGLGYLFYSAADTVVNSVTLVPGDPHEVSALNTPTPVVIRPEDHGLEGATAIPATQRYTSNGKLHPSIRHPTPIRQAQGMPQTPC
jgi:hypothetical protein